MASRRQPAPNAPNADVGSSAVRLDDDDNSDQSGDGGPAVDTSSKKPKRNGVPSLVFRGASSSRPFINFGAISHVRSPPPTRSAHVFAILWSF